MFTMLQLEFAAIIDEIKPVPEPVHKQMELGIKEDPPMLYCAGTDINLYAWNPPKNVVFSGDDNKECGRFSWDGGIFRFNGNAEPSAKIFADYIAKFLGLKLPS